MALHDGNGRVTRLLTCLILIRDGYFPFSVKRKERDKYLDTLSQADANNVQPFVDYISSGQIRAMESALNKVKKTEHETLDSIVDALKDRLKDKDAIKQESINVRRDEINNIIREYTKQQKGLLQKKLGFDIHFQSGGNTNSQWSITHQMGIYATKFDYFMKRTMPYEWFRLVGQQRFMITLFTHHFGQTDDIIAIGGVLETAIKEGTHIGKNTRKSKYGDFNIIPLEEAPLNLSLLVDNINEIAKKDIQDHVDRLILVGMTGIVAEV